MILYQHQFAFFTRVMNLPSDCWVRKVLLDHFHGDWVSPYIRYFASIRQKLGILSMPRTINSIKIILNTWFLHQTNLELSRLSLPCLTPLSSYKRLPYVCENGSASTLAKFRLNNAGLGNRAPRPGRQRETHCSLCRGTLDEYHVAFSCPSMDSFRYKNTDVMTFISLCRTKGIFPKVAFRLYLRGLDWNKESVTTTAFLKRGDTLKRILDQWLHRT